MEKWYEFKEPDTRELGKGESKRIVDGKYRKQFTRKICMRLQFSNHDGYYERSLYSRITIEITVKSCTRGVEQKKGRCTYYVIEKAWPVLQ